MQKKMQIILLKNIPKLGQEGELKEVTRGYAQNFLIPQGLAAEATPQAIAEADTRKDRLAREAEADLVRTEALVARLEGQTVEVVAKANEEGTLYAALPSSKIASALKEKGLEVKKEQIQTEIKELGEHEVTISLDHGLEARILVMVNPET